MGKAFVFVPLLLVFIAGCTAYAPESPKAAAFTAKNLPSDVQASGDHAFVAQIGIDKGNKPYDFTVNTIDGKEFNLYKNIENKKPTLVYFFATWCPFCARDFAAVDQVYPKYKDKVDFIAMSLDLNEDERIIREYRDRYNHKDIQFAPGKADILDNYAIRYTTTKYAVSKEGIILWKGSGELDAKTWETIFKGLAEG